MRALASDIQIRNYTSTRGTQERERERETTQRKLAVGDHRQELPARKTRLALKKQETPKTLHSHETDQREGNDAVGKKDSGQQSAQDSRPRERERAAAQGGQRKRRGSRLQPPRLRERRASGMHATGCRQEKRLKRPDRTRQYTRAQDAQLSLPGMKGLDRQPKKPSVHERGRRRDKTRFTEPTTEKTAQLLKIPKFQLLN